MYVYNTNIILFLLMLKTNFFFIFQYQFILCLKKDQTSSEPQDKTFQEYAENYLPSQT